MAIILPIVSTFNTAGVKAAQSSLAGLGGMLGKLGAQVAVAAVAFKGLSSAVDFVSASVTQARDLERNLSALETVFGDLTGRMTVFTEDAYKMGISQTDAARTATFLGSVLKQAGFEMGDVANETEKLTILAQDMATTFGYDTSEALTAMTALFRGEYDPIEKFGVALKQDEVNALLLAKGLGNLEGQEKLNAQQQVRLEQLYLRSADAAGAFAKQSGTLFVEQKKLTSAFTNLQAAAGAELTPAITGLMMALSPLMDELGPEINSLFAELNTILIDLIPVVKPLVQIFGQLIGAFARLLDVLSPVIDFIVAVVIVAFELLADLLTHVGSGIEGLVNFIDSLFGAVNKDFGSTAIVDWIVDFINNSVILSTLLSPIIAIIERIQGLTGKSNETSAARLRGQREDRLAIVAKVAASTTAAGPSVLKGTPAKDTIAEYYAQLADEVSKQSARLRLTNLGASEALIESIIGSGDQWMKMFTKVNNSGKKGVAELQKTFNKTANGLSEIKAAQEAADEAFKKLYDAAVERNKALEDAYKAQVATLNDYKDALKSIVASLKPLAVANRIIGQFEQSAIDSFTNIAASIKEGLASGTLTTEAANKLSAYADAEKAVFVKIGAQRDALFAKRSLAEALIGDIKSAITQFGNVNALINQQTNKVTTTVEKMVMGFKVTTSRTVDEVVGAGNMVSSFQKIVARTKAFAAQLKELRALGLDQNLYKQIVDAGVDAGSVTAEEIIKGGAGTVGELNNLFAELNTVGADIAEETAQVMYGAGVDVSKGLIAGLLAEEEALVSSAETLANAFITAFNNLMATITIPTPNFEALPTQASTAVSTVDPEKILADRLTNLRSRLDTLGKVEGAAETATAKSLMSQIRSTAGEWTAMNPNASTGVSNTTNVSVVVKAAAGVDTKKAGQDIVKVVNKYATSSGGGSVSRFI